MKLGNKGRSLIVHMGPHKTGTTALQSFFCKNRTWLESQGLYYPTAGCVYGGHHNLAWEILTDARYVLKQGGWAQLCQELDGRPGKESVLLSSEDFSVVSVAQIGQMFQLFADWDITLLFVYRPLTEMIESLYAQQVKDGTTCLSMGAFAADRIAFDQRTQLDRYFSLLIDLFAARVKVLAYKPDIVPCVVSALGLPAITVMKQAQINQRMPRDHLRQLLALRRRHCDLNWVAYYCQYVEPLLTAGIESSALDMAPEEDFALPAELAEVIAAQDERNVHFCMNHDQLEFIR